MSMSSDGSVYYLNGDCKQPARLALSHSASRATLRKHTIKRRLSLMKGRQGTSTSTSSSDAPETSMRACRGAFQALATIGDLLVVSSDRHQLAFSNAGPVRAGDWGDAIARVYCVSQLIIVRLASGQLLSVDGKVAPVRLNVQHAVALVSVGEQHAALLTEDGQLLTLGSNSDGQLGLPAVLIAAQQPQRVLEGVPLRHVCCGGVHTIAVPEDPLRHALCWGSNVCGQLGSLLRKGKLFRSAQPMTEFPVGVRRAAAGLMHSALLYASGLCRSFGDSSREQLVPASFDVICSDVVCGPYSTFLITAGGLVYPFPVVDIPAIDDLVVTGMSAGLHHQCFSSNPALEALLHCSSDPTDVYTCMERVPAALLAAYWPGIQQRRLLGTDVHLSLDVHYTDKRRTFVHVVNTSEALMVRVQMDIPAILRHPSNDVVIDPPEVFQLMPGQRKRIMIYTRGLAHTSLISVNSGQMFIVVQGDDHLKLPELQADPRQDDVLLYMIGKTIGPAAFHAMTNSGVMPRYINGRALIGSVQKRFARHAINAINKYIKKCPAVFRCCAVSVPSLSIAYVGASQLLVMEPHVQLASLATKRNVYVAGMLLDADNDDDADADVGEPLEVEPFPKLWRATKCIMLLRIKENSRYSLIEWFSILNYAIAKFNGVIFHIDYPYIYSCFDTSIAACRTSLALAAHHEEEVTIVCCYGRVVIGYWQETLTVYGHPINKCKRWMEEDGKCALGRVLVDRHCKRALVGTFNLRVSDEGFVTSSSVSELHSTAVHVRYLSHGGRGTTVLQRNSHSSLVSIDSASRFYHLTVLRGQCTEWSRELNSGVTSLAPVIAAIYNPSEFPEQSQRVSHPSDSPQYVDAFCTLLQALCNKEPIVMLVADLQWADRVTLRVLTEVSSRVNNNLLLACSYWGVKEPPGSWAVVVDDAVPLGGGADTLQRLTSKQLRALQCVCVGAGPLPVHGRSSFNARLAELCALGLLWRPTDNSVSLADPSICDDVLAPLSATQLNWIRCKVSTILRNSYDSDESDEEPVDPRRISYVVSGTVITAKSLFGDSAESSDDDSYGSLDAHSSTDFDSGDFEDDDRSYFGHVALDVRAAPKASPVPSLPLSATLVPLKKKKRRVKRKKRRQSRKAKSSVINPKK